jgi:hypothetical protein
MLMIRCAERGLYLPQLAEISSFEILKFIVNMGLE